jgi:hypothetical protein
MDVRYFQDPETGEPHIYEHGISESEVEFVLRHRVKTGLEATTRDTHLVKRQQDATSA